jgi:hypothetical protein
MSREAPRWLAPASGTVALGFGVGLVAFYTWGRAIPAHHVATVVAEVPVDPNTVGALLSDIERRPSWRPGVTRIGRVEDTSDGRAVWRELGPGGDRFDFVVLEAQPERLVIETARPEDIGMRAMWTWTVEAHGAGSRIALTEDGSVDNELFRGVWTVTDGPWEAIERDLDAFVRALGVDAPEVARQD